VSRPLSDEHETDRANQEEYPCGDVPALEIDPAVPSPWPLRRPRGSLNDSTGAIDDEPDVVGVLSVRISGDAVALPDVQRKSVQSYRQSAVASCDQRKFARDARVGVSLFATVSGSQAVTQPPLQLLTRGSSGAKIYSVIPFHSRRNSPS
jgi:hypothetical protein